MTETIVAVKERPILFSGEMVCTILDGRKTQTRRVITPQPKDGLEVRYNADNGHVLYGPEYLRSFVKCPYGVVGDRLWVRETFGCLGNGMRVYAADADTDGTVPYLITGDGAGVGNGKPDKWMPSIFMPRSASRINLEITGVRVERVQDISPDDCLAEGIDYKDCDPHNAHQYWRQEAYAKYGELWDKINKDRGYGWDVNPWVWVIEFKRLEK